MHGAFEGFLLLHGCMDAIRDSLAPGETPQHLLEMKSCGVRYDRPRNLSLGKIRILVRASFIVGYYVVNIRRKPDSMRVMIPGSVFCLRSTCIPTSYVYPLHQNNLCYAVFDDKRK